MPSPETRKRATAIAALMLPVVAVKLTTVLMGQSPMQTAVAASSAAAVVASANAPGQKPGQCTPRQRAAMQYVDSLRSQPFGPAPILFAVAPEQQVTTSTSTTITPDVITPIGDLTSVPKFSLNAVMSADSGRRAVINGRPYREGDMIHGTTWIIATIDCGKRSVTVRDSQSDRQIVVNVDLPR